MRDHAQCGERGLVNIHLLMRGPPSIPRGAAGIWRQAGAWRWFQVIGRARSSSLPGLVPAGSIIRTDDRIVVACFIGWALQENRSRFASRRICKTGFGHTNEASQQELPTDWKHGHISRVQLLSATEMFERYKASR